MHWGQRVQNMSLFTQHTPATDVHTTTDDALSDARAGKYCMQMKIQSCISNFRWIGAGGKIPPVKAPAAEAVHQTLGQCKSEAEK